MERRVAVRGIVVLDGKLFCVRLKPYKHVEATTHWCVPGGGVDKGKVLITALRREMREETGVPAEVGRLFYIQQYTFKGEEQLELFFEITNAKDYLKVDLSKTTHGLAEIDEYGFIEPSEHTVFPLFLTTENFSEALPTSAKIFNYLV